MCHLAIARCEQSIGNANGEAEALISASRCYMQGEIILFLSFLFKKQIFIEIHHTSRIDIGNNLRTLPSWHQNPLTNLRTCRGSSLRARIVQKGHMPEKLKSIFIEAHSSRQYHYFFFEKIYAYIFIPCRILQNTNFYPINHQFRVNWLLVCLRLDHEGENRTFRIFGHVERFLDFSFTKFLGNFRTAHRLSNQDTYTIL